MSSDPSVEAEPSFWPTPATGAKAKPSAPASTTPRSPVPKSAAPKAVRLPELCEPLFQYVCRLNRSARQRGLANPAQVRADVKGLITDARNLAAAGGAPPGGPSMAEQWKQVEPVMLFFVDFMIRSSSLPFAARWDDLSREMHKLLAGDERFFDLLELALADHSEAGADRVAVFYTCMGLGFTGFYTGQPEYLQRKMLDCSSRIRGMIDADGSGKVCPDAYESVNTSDLIESPARSVVGVVIALVGLAIVLVVANYYWYASSTERLRDSLRQLGGDARPAAQVAPGAQH